MLSFLVQLIEVLLFGTLALTTLLSLFLLFVLSKSLRPILMLLGTTEETSSVLVQHQVMYSWELTIRISNSGLLFLRLKSLLLGKPFIKTVSTLSDLTQVQVVSLHQHLVMEKFLLLVHMMKLLIQMEQDHLQVSQKKVAIFFSLLSQTVGIIP